MDVIIIGDTHFAATSNVRTGNYLDDLIKKLDYVVEQTNALDAQLLHTGDFFDKPTVPDFVKTRLVSSLGRLKRPCITIIGNHDRLYSSDERYVNTSMALFAEAGVLRVMFPGDTIKYDDFVLYTGRPVAVDTDKPVLVLNHGFLNQDDGLSSFYCQDIMIDNPMLVVLGHDHVVYEPVKYKNAVILRAGSFTRAIRNDGSDRIPVYIRAGVRDGKWVYKTYPIKTAVPVEYIFKTSMSKVKKSEISYQTLIETIKNVSDDELSLEKCLLQVTTKDVVEFIMNKL